LSILLPSMPGPSSAQPSYIDYGGILRPFLGGDDQKLNRLGDRFALVVTMPPMPTAAAMVWVSRLIQAQKSGAIMEWPQPDFDTGNPGFPAVRGSGAGGTSLPLKSVVAAYRILEGQFMSVIHGGRRYLHMANADAVMNGSGQTTLSVSPMIRPVLNDGDVVEIAKPMIEGFLEGNALTWNIDLARTVGLQFTIREAA
jgi:hypothetical protein